MKGENISFMYVIASISFLKEFLEVSASRLQVL